MSGQQQALLQQVTSDTAVSAPLRKFLYLTALICGAAVLVVEILGAKMLAPYFGSSHFVWTSQIAVTLISLSLGYYLGGRLADRSADLGRLYWCIFAAAAYLCLTVPLTRPVAEACLEMNLALGSLVASTFLFLIPLGLLAMVAPFLVRVMTSSLSVVGRQVGRLSAISTIGSVAGTILIGYVLIPFFPNSTTMMGTSAVLAVLSAIYLLAWGRKAHPRTAGTLLLLAAVTIFFVMLFPASPRLGSMVEIARVNSNFGELQVMKVRGRPHYRLLNDFLSQNAYDTERKQSVHTFTYVLEELPRGYTREMRSALCIGMGVGIVPMKLSAAGVETDVVEINPAVVPLAKRYFDFDEGRVRLVIDDGRHFLNQVNRKYDTIILDAFVGDSSPSHLMTREAFSAMRNALSPGGTLVINSFGDLRPGEDFYTASLHKTLSSVFRHVRIHAAHDDGNVFFVASDRDELTMLREPNLNYVHPDVRTTVTLAMRRIVSVDHAAGIVLTDDYNPVEFYDARNRERIRRELVAWANQ